MLTQPTPPNKTESPQDALEKLRLEYVELCRRIVPTHSGWLFQTTPAHDGTPHIEWADGVWYYLATDRGCEVMRQTTTDKAELLYWLLRDVAWGMAIGYEFKHRVPGQSFRRLLFAKQLELLTRVDPIWAERRGQEIAIILAEHPYDDEREG